MDKDEEPEQIATVPTVPNIHVINDIEYYDVLDLVKTHPLVVGRNKCKPRNAIISQQIPENVYIYVVVLKKQTQWTLCGATTAHSHLMILKKWVDDKQTEMNEYLIKQQNKPKASFIKHDIIQPLCLTNDNVAPEVDEPMSILPPLLKLSEHEKFKDVNGVTIELTFCGERSYEGIWIKASDVSIQFGLPLLKNCIIDKDSGYTRNIHYNTFASRTPLTMAGISCHSQGGQKNGRGRNRSLYLTYRGLTKVLFSSRSPNAEHFQKWACEMLFTIQMGTKAEQTKLSAKLLGMSADDMMNMLSSHSNKFPCIYLIILGTVKDLRESMNISAEWSDDLLVCKYGFTDSYKRRIPEHQATYETTYKNAVVRPYAYNYIDPQFLSKAEGEIRQIVSVFEKKLNVDGKNDLAMFSTEQLALIKTQYGFIGKKYMGESNEMQQMIVQLEAQVLEKDHQLLHKDHEIKDREHIITQKNMIIDHMKEMEKKNQELHQARLELVEFMRNERNKK
jgi:prophage antirepressor-like protein